MNACIEILRALERFDELPRAVGRIEGELREIRKLSERVSRLEVWLAWMKGGWAALGAAGAMFWKTGFTK